MIIRSVTLTLVLAVFVPLAFIAGTLGMWAGDRKPPTRIVSLDVLTPTVRPGQELKVRIVAERDRACETHIDRVLVDADNQRQVLDDIDSAAPLGPTTYTAIIHVPAFFKPGTAHYITSSAYSCNPIHKWFPVYGGARDTPFEVVP